MTPEQKRTIEWFKDHYPQYITKVNEVAWVPVILCGRQAILYPDGSYSTSLDPNAEIFPPRPRTLEG